MKMFFTKRVAEYWNRLPREAVTALSLPEFKKAGFQTCRLYGRPAPWTSRDG